MVTTLIQVSTTKKVGFFSVLKNGMSTKTLSKGPNKQTDFFSLVKVSFFCLESQKNSYWKGPVEVIRSNCLLPAGLTLSLDRVAHGHVQPSSNHLSLGRGTYSSKQLVLLHSLICSHHPSALVIYEHQV